MTKEFTALCVAQRYSSRVHTSRQFTAETKDVVTAQASKATQMAGVEWVEGCILIVELGSLQNEITLLALSAEAL